MVRTRREPNGFYGFEDLTVEGLARPPGRLVPRQARETLLAKGYVFDDHYVLIEEFEQDSPEPESPGPDSPEPGSP